MLLSNIGHLTEKKKKSPQKRESKEFYRVDSLIFQEVMPPTGEASFFFVSFFFIIIIDIKLAIFTWQSLSNFFRTAFFFKGIEMEVLQICKNKMSLKVRRVNFKSGNYFICFYFWYMENWHA